MEENFGFPKTNEKTIALTVDSNSYVVKMDAVVPFIVNTVSGNQDAFHATVKVGVKLMAN